MSHHWNLLTESVDVMMVSIYDWNDHRLCVTMTICDYYPNDDDHHVCPMNDATDGHRCYYWYYHLCNVYVRKDSKEKLKYLLTFVP